MPIWNYLIYIDDDDIVRRPSPNQVDHFPHVFIVDLCQKDGFLSAPARQVTTLTRTFALQVGHQPPPANSPGRQWFTDFFQTWDTLVISTEELKKYIQIVRLSFSAPESLEIISESIIWMIICHHLSLLQSLFLFCDLSGWSWQCKEGENLDNDPSRVETPTTAAAKERCGQLARRTQHSESSSWFTWWWVFWFWGAERWFWRSQVEDKNV